MEMEFEKIRSLVSMMGEYNLSEIKIEMDGCNLCLRRNCGEVPVAPVAVAATPVAAAPAPVAVAAAPAPAAAAADQPRETIDSPLVGTL